MFFSAGKMGTCCLLTRWSINQLIIELRGKVSSPDKWFMKLIGSGNTRVRLKGDISHRY